eukprot:992828-Prymnesium_polylepis.1
MTSCANAWRASPALTQRAWAPRRCASVAPPTCREYTGEAGKGLVKRRGRWASDVAEVYQRELVGTQLELSARMGSAFDTSLEEVVPGWVQPA